MEPAKFKLFTGHEYIHSLHEWFKPSLYYEVPCQCEEMGFVLRAKYLSNDEAP